jgi:hypothetical protein
MFSMHALPQEINRAAEIGDIKKIKELLKNNPESVNAKNKYNLTPLHYAALYGNKNVAELLILNGADIQTKIIDGTTPLHLAALHIENQGIDIVFGAPVLDSPLWKDNKPQYYIAMHIRPEQMESRSKEILKENPDVIIFKETMEKKVFK